jgi:hypothetical protein
VTSPTLPSSSIAISSVRLVSGRAYAGCGSRLVPEDTEG